MKRDFWFIATQRFDPLRGEAWKSYLAFSGLTQLDAVVSLDGLLNPKVILERIEEDWEHNVQVDEWTDYFLDLKYLVQRLGPRAVSSNVLAVIAEPAAEDARRHPVPQNPQAFDFVGYDLIEGPGGISALTNCGGFDEVFKPEDLSPLGLIRDFSRAKTVQDELRAHYSDEPHANCKLMALWLLAQAPLN